MRARQLSVLTERSLGAVRDGSRFFSSKNSRGPLVFAAVISSAVLLLSGCAPTWQGSPIGSMSDGASQNQSSDQSSSSGSSDGAGSSGASGSSDNSGNDSGSSGDSTASVAFTATLMMAGQSFTFAPKTCINEDAHLVVSGPGVDDGDKSPVFLDIDIGEDDGWRAGPVVLYFNTSKRAPTNPYFEAMVGGGDDYSMGDMLNGYEVEVFFRNQDGVPTGPGTFTINCG